MRIHQLCDEIKHYDKPIRRSASEIFRVLDSNKKIFAEHLTEDSVESFCNGFERLAASHPSVHGTPAFERDFERLYQSLLYSIDRII